jgi:hypothetical protein
MHSDRQSDYRDGAKVATASFDRAVVLLDQVVEICKNRRRR